MPTCCRRSTNCPPRCSDRTHGRSRATGRRHPRRTHGAVPGCGAVLPAHGHHPGPRAGRLLPRAAGIRAALGRGGGQGQSRAGLPVHRLRPGGHAPDGARRCTGLAALRHGPVRHQGPDAGHPCTAGRGRVCQQHAGKTGRPRPGRHQRRAGTIHLWLERPHPGHCRRRAGVHRHGDPVSPRRDRPAAGQGGQLPSVQGHGGAPVGAELVWHLAWRHPSGAVVIRGAG